MDSDRQPARAWVLPVVFALVGLSMPAQVYIREHVAEPYPGLFQPTFSDVPRHGDTVKYRVIVFDLDGRAVNEKALLPGTNSGKRRKLFESLFPPNGDAANVDPETIARLRSRLAEDLDSQPRTLTATWERRRFDLNTRETSTIKTLSQYRIDLTGGQR